MVELRARETNRRWTSVSIPQAGCGQCAYNIPSNPITLAFPMLMRSRAAMMPIIMICGSRIQSNLRNAVFSAAKSADSLLESSFLTSNSSSFCFFELARSAETSTKASSLTLNIGVVSADTAIACAYVLVCLEKTEKVVSGPSHRERPRRQEKRERRRSGHCSGEFWQTQLLSRSDPGRVFAYVLCRLISMVPSHSNTLVHLTAMFLDLIVIIAYDALSVSQP